MQRDLSAEQAVLDEYSTKQVTLEVQQETNNKKISALQLDCVTLRTNIEQQQRQLHAIEQTLSLYQQEKGHYQRERESLLSQIEKESTKQQLTKQCIVKFEQQLFQLSVDDRQLVNQQEIAEHIDDALSFEQYSQQHAILQSELENIQQKNQVLHQQRHQLALTIAQLETQKIQHEQSIATHQESISTLTKRLAFNSQAENDHNTPLQNVQQNLPQWLDKLSKINNQLAVNQTVLNDSQTQLSAIELELKSNQNKISTLNEQLTRLQLETEGFKLRSENTLEILTELQQNAASVIEEMPAQAKESLWQAQLIKLAKDIQLLGAINLAAIDEYETQIERKNYLDQQDQDLNSAIETLESAIAKIDKESRHKFKLTFDQVDNDLQRLFPKVFGGGRAYLALTGEDLLDTGVTIMARPPGKKNSTIHLLSGGEKALTALSLVLSLIHI